MKRLACAAFLAAVSLACASGGGPPVEIPLLEATIAPHWPAAERPLAAIQSVVRDVPEAASRDLGVAAVGTFNAVAAIRSAVPIEEQVRDSLARALRVHAVLAEDPERAAYQVAVVVDRLSVREFATGSSPEHSRACVLFDVLVRDRAGALLFAKEFEARVVTESTWSDATRLNEPALRQALRESLDALFADAQFAALFEPLPAAEATAAPAEPEAAAPADPVPAT